METYFSLLTSNTFVTASSGPKSSQICTTMLNSVFNKISLPGAFEVHFHFLLAGVFADFLIFWLFLNNLKFFLIILF